MTIHYNGPESLHPGRIACRPLVELPGWPASGNWSAVTCGLCLLERVKAQPATEVQAAAIAEAEDVHTDVHYLASEGMRVACGFLIGDLSATRDLAAVTCSDCRYELTVHASMSQWEALGRDRYFTDGPGRDVAARDAELAAAPLGWNEAPVLDPARLGRDVNGVGWRYRT